jgi:hypothetical protein
LAERELVPATVAEAQTTSAKGVTAYASLVVWSCGRVFVDIQQVRAIPAAAFASRYENVTVAARV